MGRAPVRAAPARHRGVPPVRARGATAARAGAATLSRAHPAPRRLADGRVLVTRHVVAYLAHRHVDHVRKHVPAVACDVASRAVLLDLDQAEDILGGMRHRNRLTPLPG